MKKLVSILGIFVFFASFNQSSLAEEVQASSSGKAATGAVEIPFGEASLAMKSAAQENKFLFILVAEKQDEQTTATRKIVEEAAKKLAEKAKWFELDRNKPSEKDVVEKFDLMRAPMPLVLVIAPNGAVTAGLIGDKATAEKIGEGIVSTGFQQLLKALQSEKLVFLCVQNQATKSNDEAMKGVNEFKADPTFASDVEIIRVDPSDQKEEKLLTELKIDPKTRDAVTAFLAPPGSPLAIFTGATSREKIESALKSAGKGGCGPGGCGPGGCK